MGELEEIKAKLDATTKIVEEILSDKHHKIIYYDEEWEDFGYRDSNNMLMPVCYRKMKR